MSMTSNSGGLKAKHCFMLVQNDRCRFKAHWRHESLSDFFCVVFWWKRSCKSHSPYKNFIVCLNKGTGKSKRSQAVKQQIWLVKSKAVGNNNSVHQYLVLTRNCVTKIAVWECKIHLFGHKFGIKKKKCSCKHSTPLFTCKILKTTYLMQKGVFYSLFPPNKLAITI